MSAAVLLAESEPMARTFLEQHLIDNGFAVLSKPEDGRPHLVLTGDLEAVDVWRGEVPVIVLGQEEAGVVERVRAFELGCDDYVGRPFHYEELLARIRAVLRRAGFERLPVIEAGPLVIDEAARMVTVGGARVSVSQKEFLLLRKLATEPRRVFRREELLREIWGFRSTGRTRTLDSHASRLRRKLRAVEGGESLVVNVWGVGYKLLDD